MSIDQSSIQNVRESAVGRGLDLSEAYGEVVLWRHRKIAEVRPEADNEHRMDPQGTTYKTEDHYRYAAKRDTGEDVVFMGQFVPVVGDLIATLKPSPSSKEAAREARATAYYRVMDVRNRRSPSGRLVHSIIEVKPDRSGRW